MKRLINGARFNPQKTRQHMRKQDPELSDKVKALWENAGERFRKADPNGEASYILSCRMAGYSLQRSYQ